MEERRDLLRRELEKARFERAMEVAGSIADHRALLTTTELARLNRILTGQKEDSDPWRREAVTVTLPGGRSAQIELIADPILNSREKLHKATELAETGAPLEAVIFAYTGLVMSHFFKDANRRTAALAAHYFLRRYGIPLSGLAIHELGLGDLRQAGQIDALRETLGQMIKFAAKRES